MYDREKSVFVYTSTKHNICINAIMVFELRFHIAFGNKYCLLNRRPKYIECFEFFHKQKFEANKETLLPDNSYSTKTGI